MKKGIFNVLIVAIIAIATLFGLSIKLLAASANTSLEGSNITSSSNTNTNNTNSSSTNTSASNTSSSNTSSSSTSSSSNSASINTKTTTSSSSNSSSNANLSNLGIRPNDFTGFKPSVTTYNVTVPENVNSVDIYATAQSSSAKISGTGTTKLEEGTTTAKVTVTAKDGTTKTYTLNITRGGDNSSSADASSSSDESENEDKGLKSLKINDLQLEPEFNTNTYEYSVKYIGQDTSLNIQAEPTSDDYNVEIVGNEDLQEGENTITILVSDDSGKNVATYQVTVNKSLVDEEAIAKQEAQEKKQRMMIIACAVVLIIVIIIVIIAIKKRKSKNYAEEFSGVPFYGMNKERDDSEEPKNLKEDIEADDDDLPKALRKELNKDDNDKSSKNNDKNRHGKRFK